MTKNTKRTHDVVNSVLSDYNNNTKKTYKRLKEYETKENLSDLVKQIDKNITRRKKEFEQFEKKWEMYDEIYSKMGDEKNLFVKNSLNEQLLDIINNHKYVEYAEEAEEDDDETEEETDEN